MIYRVQTAHTQHGHGTEELTTQKSCPNSTKAREGNFDVANVQYEAEYLRKDWAGTMAIMMQGGSHRLGSVTIVITPEKEKDLWP